MKNPVNKSNAKWRISTCTMHLLFHASIWLCFKAKTITKKEEKRKEKKRKKRQIYLDLHRFEIFLDTKYQIVVHRHLQASDSDFRYIRWGNYSALLKRSDALPQLLSLTRSKRERDEGWYTILEHNSLSGKSTLHRYHIHARTIL